MTTCQVCAQAAKAKGLCQRHYDQMRKPKKEGPRAKKAPKHDLAGRGFKDATVVSRAEPGTGSKARWNCKCRCGADVVLFETHLLRGMTGTCNHGLANTPEWSSWSAMRLRVLNPNHEAYNRYGGRGVLICARWDNFLNFLQDMGPRPAGMTLDRFPNKDGNYRPGNCRWATPQQQQNNLSSNRFVEYQGEIFTVSDLARKLGVKYETMYSRVVKGAAVDEWRGRHNR